MPQQPVPIRVLTIARGRLWNTTPALRKLLCRAAWYQHCQKHHRNYGKARKRVDVCHYCFAYDRRYRQEVEAATAKARGRVVAIAPDYFKEFDTVWERRCADDRHDPTGKASSEYLASFIKLLNRDLAAVMRVMSYLSLCFRFVFSRNTLFYFCHPQRHSRDTSETL
jgi:hypothetical protein